MKPSTVVIIVFVFLIPLLGLVQVNNETLHYWRHLFCHRYDSVSLKLRFPRQHNNAQPAFSHLHTLEAVLENLRFQGENSCSSLDVSVLASQG